MLHAQWESIGLEVLPSFHRVWSIKMASDYSVWVFSTYDAFPLPVGEAPVVHRLADGSNEWISSRIPDSEMTIGSDIEPLDSMTAYAAAFFSGLIKTTDGSATWQKIDSYPFNPFFVHFFDEDNGWVAGADTTTNAFFVSSFTTDGGATWSHTGSAPIGQAPGTSIPQLDPTEGVGIAYSANSSYDVVGDTIIMGRSSGAYWMSIDRGKNWERINSPLADMGLQCTNVAMKNHQEFLIAGNITINGSQEVAAVSFITQDGGATWMEGSPIVTPAAAHYIPGTDGIYIIAGHRAFGGEGAQGTAITYDYGESWEYIDDTRLIAMDFVDAEHGVATCCNIWADTQGQIYKWNLEVPTPVFEKPLSQHISLSPNPTSGPFELSFSEKPTSGKISVQIITYDGRIVKNITVPYSPKISLDISDLPAGLFFLKIGGGREVVTKKIIKN